MTEHETRLSPADVLGELDWLRRLARSLVGGLGADEDLVQETWLAASGVEGGVSRPWLVSTLRRLAARFHRTESRRRRRERSVARREGVDTPALLERNEVLGHVLEQLRGIDEPFRTTLILLYQEGLSVREAAGRLGLPEDTLRWRHREGMSRLRARLDRGNRSDWRSCLLPLLGPSALGPAPGGTAAAAAAKTLTSLGGPWMTWKSISLLGALLLVPLALWGLGEDPPVPEGAPVEPLGSSRARGGAELQPAPAARGAGREQVAAASTATEDRAVAGVGSPGTGLAVTVTDADRVPIPGAEVWLGTAPDPVAPLAVSDATGAALLPMPEQTSFYVSGATDGLYGQTPVLRGMSGGEVRLVLTPDADVPVLVVDQQGQPLVDVPVGVVRRKRLKDPTTGAERDILNFHDVVETDEQGRAVVRHVRNRLRSSGDTARFSIGPAVLLGSRDDVAFTHDELPPGPVRITMPPLGSLDVRVLDASGSPNRQATQARVLVDAAPGLPREVPELVEQARFGAAGLVSVDLQDGVGRIPMIDLGLELLAEAREAEPTGSTFGLGPGPVVAAGTAQLTLRPRDVAMELVGVALDAQGAPLASRRLLTELVIARGLGFGATRLELTTDATGRFRVFVDDEDRERWAGARRRTLHLVATGSGPADSSAATCTLPEVLVLGENDLGEVVLEPRTPLLAGRVLTEQGQDAEIEYLWLVVKNQHEGRRVRFVLDARKVLEGGRFAFFGEPVELDSTRGEVLELQVTSRGRLGQAQVVSEGDLDLSFVLADGGFLAGRVLLGPEQDFQDYYVDFRAPELPGDYPSHLPGSLASNGRFSLEGLPRRVGDVEVRDHATKTLLAVVPRVEPGPAPDVVDPRLAGIELPGTLDEYILEVTDAEGRGLVGAEFDSPRLPHRTSSYGGGRFQWRAAGGSLDGTVSAPGYRGLDVTLTPGERVVVLDRGPEVVVRPVPAVELPDGARLLLLLAGGERYEEVRLSSQGDGSFAGFVSGPGTYRVRGRLVRGGVLVADLPLSTDPLAALEVPEDGSDATLEVPFDRAAFEASLTED